MKHTLRRHWPLLTVLALLWIAVAVFLYLSCRQNAGHLIYASDDPYIHMAMARNLVQHGVFGVTRYEFSSASSSLLWTLLLALVDWLCGVHPASALVLNVLFATLLLVVLEALLRRWQVPALVRLPILLGVLLFPPVTTLIFIGMEHVLHILLTILFVCWAAETLAGPPSPAKTAGLAALAVILPLVRYEGLFAVLGVCILLFFRRRWWQALWVGALSILPLVVYGAVSSALGWFWLPNPILLKGNYPGLSFIERFLVQLATSPEILLPLIAAGILIVYRLRSHGLVERGQLLLAQFVFVGLLHMLFSRAGRFGWFYRYEAYLVALGVFIVATVFWDTLREKGPSRVSSQRALRDGAVLVLALLTLVVWGRRAVLANGQIPRATTNMYEQDYQLGLFLQQYYRGAVVAVNDIGAVNYLADIRCLDLMGLGTVEALQLRLAGDASAAGLDALVQSRGARIAAVYEHWFEIPSRWILVGRWTIADNVAMAGDTVSFYALDPDAETKLIDGLQQFAPQLPSTVLQSGRYTQDRW
jgi:hypothetical protein